jgi:NAD+ diphosphatase
VEPHGETNALDRAAELRERPDELARLARSDDAQLIVHRGSAVPVTRDGQAQRLVRLPTSTALERGALLDDMMFLGLLDDAPVFGLQVSESEDDLLSAGVLWVDLIVASMTLPAGDAALANYLVGLSNWRRTHSFCPRCGQSYEVRDGGHLLVCPSGHRSHPRVEPVVQMLVHDGDRCLLGRSPGWPAGWFSTLAGFIEPGETPEEATAREVQEEAGLEVIDVRYSGAQFWAGPYSLMLGFTALVAGVSTAMPGAELETIITLTRTELRTVRAKETVRTPSAAVLAGTLIDQWLDDPSAR